MNEMSKKSQQKIKLMISIKKMSNVESDIAFGEKREQGLGYRK